jgi:hypothetical protein
MEARVVLMCILPIGEALLGLKKLYCPLFPGLSKGVDRGSRHMDLLNSLGSYSCV